MTKEWKKSKKIEITVKGTNLLELKQFENFQGNLKEISEEALEKLKNNIIKNGFCAPIFVWSGKKFILDGHQRIIAVKSLIEDGYVLENNELPYIEIEAKDKKQAAELVLSYNSQYGEITEDGLKEFKDKFELDLSELDNTINIPIGLDVDVNLTEEPNEKDLSEELPTKNKCPKCEYEW